MEPTRGGFIAFCVIIWRCLKASPSLLAEPPSLLTVGTAIALITVINYKEADHAHQCRLEFSL